MGSKLGIGVGHSPSSGDVVLSYLDGFEGPSVPVDFCCCTYSGSHPYLNSFSL